MKMSGQGIGIREQGLGVRDRELGMPDSGFRKKVCDSGLRTKVSDSGFRKKVCDSGFRENVRDSGSGTKVQVTGLLLVLTAALFLAGRITGGIANNIALPTVTLSPTAASVPVGGALQFTATVVSTTSVGVTWAVNNVPGGSTTLGTVSSSGLYAAPAAIPNPATVTVTATAVTTSPNAPNPPGSATITITPATNTAVTLAPTDAWVLTGASVQFAATITGSTNPAVTWSVNGVAGGNSSVGTITTAGIYTAPTAAPNPPTVVVTATSQAETSQSASATLTVTVSNASPLYVNFGLVGDTGNPSTNYYNGLNTSVTVCLPGTLRCQTIPDILVDTGSVGLRVLNSALTTVPATELRTVEDSAGNQVEECVQFGDTSYAWGPVLVADVKIAGETGSNVPMQVIGDTTFTVPATSCLSLGSGPSLDSVQALGANGILGVGNFVQDCGLNCSGGQSFSGYPYYICPQNVCQIDALPVQFQVSNPVAFFAKDNNGLEVLLPSIASAGAPALPYTNADGTSMESAGQLIFGVGTQSNNALGSATIYATDESGNFPQIVYNGFTYASDGFLDSGSNALYVSDAQTLGIQDCTDNPYYCPGTAFPLALTLYGANGTSGTVNLSIANADMLFANNPTYAAFDDLGGPSGTGLSSDYFDLGLPFFFGRPVFVGIAGTTVPGSANAPNGYFAF